jgi:hypothetical protein
MSKRNFILLIIILIIAIIGFFVFLYFNQPVNTTGENTTGGTNFFSQFNPFGNSKTTPPVTTPPVNVSGYVPPIASATAKLIKVSSMPIAGFTVYQKERLKEINPTPTLPLSGEGAVVSPPAKGGSGGLKPATAPLTEFAPSLRYVARATGNIYESFADKIEERQFSGTIIPKVYEAYFGNKGTSVIMRYLKTDNQTIETFLGTLPKEYLGADTTTVNNVTGSFLPENIEDVSLSPDTVNVFYLFNIGDNMAGTTLNLLTNKKTQIFTSPFTEWLPSWSNTKIITLTTKPASGIPGYVYKIDATTGKNLTEIFGGINGLTTLPSPDGKLVLYSDDSLSLFVYHLDTKVSDLLGVKTLPEKCVWGNASDIIYCAVPKLISAGAYPDSWYQGEVSFSDQFWKIDIKTGNATMLLDPSTVLGGSDIDGIKLALDADENYLFFVNKKDSYLWEYSLK